MSDTDSAESLTISNIDGETTDTEDDEEEDSNSTSSSDISLVDRMNNVEVSPKTKKEKVEK